MNFQPHPFALRRAVRDLPPELHILRGHVDDVVLRRTARAGAAGSADSDCPVAALIAEGHIGERAYYRTLATHLDLPFRDDWPALAPHARRDEALGSSAVRLGGDDLGTWLVAPEGLLIRRLMAAPRAALHRCSLTTPAHCAALVQFGRQASIERTACDALPHLAPRFSAKRIAGRRFKIAAAIALLTAAVAWIIAPALMATLLGIVFLAGLLFKIAVTAVSLRPEAQATQLVLLDDDLPTYSVLVPLRPRSSRSFSRPWPGSITRKTSSMCCC